MEDEKMYKSNVGRMPELTDFADLPPRLDTTLS